MELLTLIVLTRRNELSSVSLLCSNPERLATIWQKLRSRSCELPPLEQMRGRRRLRSDGGCKCQVAIKVKCVAGERAGANEAGRRLEGVLTARATEKVTLEEEKIALREGEGRARGGESRAGEGEGRWRGTLNL
ncbi:Uncharacterized protein Rs2_09868 [Raphanus sativus]|nr:Uncharacterized protein Rs2_09868 [Raphanus sativus]